MKSGKTKPPPMPGATGFIHYVDESPAYWMQDILLIMLADAEDTGGRWSMMYQKMPKGIGPPPHNHLWSDEIYYILNSTINFYIEGEIKIVGKGGFVMIAQ